MTLLDGRDEPAKRLVVTPALQADFQDILGAPEPGDDAGINKTEVIRQIIREHGVNGASPTDVWQGIQNRKIQMHRNYVYAVLARLAEKNEVKQVNGRYTLSQIQ